MNDRRTVAAVLREERPQDDRDLLGLVTTIRRVEPRDLAGRTIREHLLAKLTTVVRRRVLVPASARRSVHLVRPAGQPAPDSRVAVIVCAWCEHFQQPMGSVRPVLSRQWLSVSHAAVQALKAARLASHGLCATCRPLLAREWGLYAAAAVPLGQQGPRQR